MWTFHEWAEHQDREIITDVYSGDCYQLKQIPIFRQNENIVDVGACIGAFERLAFERNPKSTIICVEVCPENIPILKSNAAPSTKIIQAAMTYRKEQLSLLNAVFPDCVSTGGSIICSNCPDINTKQYHFDQRPIVKVTIEEVINQFSMDFIDILKLDCEGSEFDILEHCDLSKIRMIIGEYHGWNNFQGLIDHRFREWKAKIIKEGELGLFWLTNYSATS